MKKNYLMLFIMLAVTAKAWAQLPNKKEKADSTRKAHILKEISITEMKRKLKNDTISPSLKLGIPLLSIPQNIISVSSILLKEQGAFVLRDAVRNASGVYLGLNNNVFDGSSNVYMRGFAQNDIFRNGLPSGNFQGSQDDEAVIDRIEFIKGPAGFLGSSGEAGGRINVVTKTPAEKAILNATLTLGSYNFYRASIDAGSAVKEKGFSYRLNVAYNYQQYYLDIMKSNKVVIAPVIQYNFSKRTFVLAEYILNNQNAINGSTYTKFFSEDKVLMDNKYANYQADPGLPLSTSKSRYARFVIKHEFNDNWKLTSQSSYAKIPSKDWSFLAEETGWNAVGFDENGIAHRLSYRSFNNNKVLSTQLFLNGKFHTGKDITHHILVGGEYFTTKDSTYQSYGTKSFLLDINNLQYGLNRADLEGNQELSNWFQYDNKFAAAYLYNTINLGSKLIITLGGRYTYNKRDNTGILTPKVATLRQRAFSPRAGITYLIDQNTAVFALYDQSFVPTGGQDKAGTAFKPILGEDREIGVKRSWFSKLLSTSVTVFDISRNNMLTEDPTDRKFNKQLGQVRSKGIEIDVIGDIGHSISVSANYAYTKAKITKATDPAIIDQLYSSSPREVINTWVRYAFPANVARGLSVTLGQTSIIKKATTTVNAFIPDYTKFDGSVAYSIGKMTTRLLLDNLTNRRYMETGDIYNGNAYYKEGVPLNFKLSVGIRL